MSHDYAYVSSTTHPHYTETVAPLQKVRHFVEGGWKVKRETYNYLPHPSQIDTKSKEQQVRYNMYLALAEFDEYPAMTLRSWLGKLRTGETSVELPDKLGYLVQSADGDGTSITASMESTASNLFQAKYHILVADYQGLSETDIESLSLADVQQLRPRATIKQYSRESLVDWNFRRINGVMQLGYMKLREVGCVFDRTTGTREDVESFLILALDDNGNYYQQKEVDGQKGEESPVTVSGQPLTWLPVEVVCDEEMPVGQLPQGMGMLYPIVEATQDSYVISADYGEALRQLTPTTFTSGWRLGSMDVFKEANGQRDYLLFGPGYVNNLPEGVTVSIESVNDNTAAFERKLDRLRDKIRAFGGAVPKDNKGNMTATEADINSSNEVAMFTPIADSLERAYRRIISYCAMFEGVWSPDDVETRLDDITIKMPRDFATPKLSVEEVRVLFEALDRGVKTREQVVKQLANGGWDYQDAQLTIDELDNEAPPPSVLSRQLTGDGA